MGCVYESTIQKSTNNLNLAHLLTVPRRSVILSSGYVTTSDIIPDEISIFNKDSLNFHTIPTKEYPYYSPHHVSYSSTSAGNNKLQRITVEPNVESSWFFSSSKKPLIPPKVDKASSSSRMDGKPKMSSVDSSLAIPTTSVSIKLRILKEPELNWAAERCEFQPDFLIPKPVQDLEIQRKARLSLVTSQSICSRGGNYPENERRNWPLRYDYYSTCDYNEYEVVCLGELKKAPQRPESYYSWSIMQMCAYPLYLSATVAYTDVFENTNLFCEPTPFKDYAKIVTNVGMKMQSSNSLDRNLAVAICTKTDVIASLEELAEIPVFSDIPSVAEMKKFCENKNVNEATMTIWLGVLKTNIMRVRPILPLVSVSKLHGTATIANEDLVIFEDSHVFDRAPILTQSLNGVEGKLTSTFPSLIAPAVIRARAMPLTVHRQSLYDTSNLQALCYPIEVIECFCVDVCHAATAGSLRSKNLIGIQTEKCSESRTYIRDYIDSYWSEPIEEFMVLDIIDNLSSILFVTATISISSNLPLATACTVYQSSYGETQPYPVVPKVVLTGEHLKKNVDAVSLIKSNIVQLERNPFRIVSGIRSIAEASCCEILNSGTIIPSFQCTQHHAKLSVQAETSSDWLTLISPPVDTFWYFKLDTPQTQRRGISQPEKDLDITDAPDLERSATPLPILGKAKSYQLFLPDPNIIDQLAGSFVTDEEAKHSSSETDVTTISVDSENQVLVAESEMQNEDVLESTDLVLGSVKERKIKGERRVVIADPPATIVNVDSPSSSPSLRKRLGSFGKLISYQRPKHESPQRNKHPRPKSRDRSKSRKRREQREKDTEEDIKAIHELQNSVQSVSYLLDRRRAVGRSSYYGSGTSASYQGNNETDSSSLSASTNTERHRGRARERVVNTENTLSYSSIKEDRQRYSATSSSSIMPPNSQDTQGHGGSGIRNLLGVAQSWIFNHTSRSERSEDRSKSLLRKSLL